MLIYDASYRVTNKGGEGLQDYLSGKVTMDAAPGDFKEEDHPREGKGASGGGRFKTSPKTIEKQDDLGDPSEKSSPKKETSNSSSGIDADAINKDQLALMDEMSKWDDNGTFAKKLGSENGDKAYREISLVRGAATRAYHDKKYDEARKQTDKWRSMMESVKKGQMPTGKKEANVSNGDAKEKKTTGDTIKNLQARAKKIGELSASLSEENYWKIQDKLDKWDDNSFAHAESEEDYKKAAQKLSEIESFAKGLAGK